MDEQKLSVPSEVPSEEALVSSGEAAIRTMPGASRAKAVLQVVVFVAFAILSIQILAIIAFAVVPNLFVVSAVSTFLGSVAGSALAMRIFYQRPVVDVGLHWNPIAARNVAIGILLGLASAAAVTVFPTFFTGLHWEPTGGGLSVGGIVVFFVVILFGAIGEEVLFRGFPMQRLLETFGPIPTVLTTSLLFGAAHALNPAATWISVANTTLWGAVFACAYLKSRDLWLPIGLHAGWNWMLPLLGVELSGFTLEVTGYRLVGGNSIWDGGAYGPEAGLLTTLIVPLLLLILWRSPIRRSA